MLIGKQLNKISGAATTTKTGETEKPNE